MIIISILRITKTIAMMMIRRMIDTTVIAIDVLCRLHCTIWYSRHVRFYMVMPWYDLASMN